MRAARHPVPGDRAEAHGRGEVVHVTDQRGSVLKVRQRSVVGLGRRHDQTAPHRVPLARGHDARRCRTAAPAKGVLMADRNAFEGLGRSRPKSKDSPGPAPITEHRSRGSRSTDLDGESDLRGGPTAGGPGVPVELYVGARLAVRRLPFVPQARVGRIAPVLVGDDDRGLSLMRDDLMNRADPRPGQPEAPRDHDHQELLVLPIHRGERTGREWCEVDEVVHYQVRSRDQGACAGSVVMRVPRPDPGSLSRLRQNASHSCRPECARATASPGSSATAHSAVRMRLVSGPLAPFATVTPPAR